jgi:hypothetical protein
VEVERHAHHDQVTAAAASAGVAARACGPGSDTRSRSVSESHADNVIEDLELAAVELLLARAGVDLVEIKGEDNATHRIGTA